jgi:hypothetical protein
VSTVLQPELFLAVTETQTPGAALTNDWNDLNNVLVEDANYAWTEWSVSALRPCWTMNLSQPDFPAYPADEFPTRLQLTLNIYVQESASSGSVRDLVIKMGDGVERVYNAPAGDSVFRTLSYAGYLSDWGLTPQQADDVVKGVTAVQVWLTSDDPDSIVRIRWAKLDAIVQDLQTEVRAPALVF